MDQNTRSWRKEIRGFAPIRAILLRGRLEQLSYYILWQAHAKESDRGLQEAKNSFFLRLHTSTLSDWAFRTVNAVVTFSNFSAEDAHHLMVPRSLCSYSLHLLDVLSFL